MQSAIEEIYQSALKFLMPLTAPEAYAAVVNEALRLTDAKYGSIFLLKDGEMKRVYASDSRLYEVSPRKNGMTYKVFRDGKSHIRSPHQSEKIHPGYKDIQIGYNISLPLRYQNVSIGVLSIFSKPNDVFTKKELHILELFVPLAVLTIRKAHLSEELQTAIEHRDLFISLAAHELRTPLTTILIYTQLLEKMISEGKIPEIQKIRKLIDEETRIKRIINELLQVDNIKSGNFLFVMSKCDLRSIINRAIETYNNIHKHHQIICTNLVKKKDLTIWGDYDKLLQAIINVLNNSAKYSEKGKNVLLSISENRKCYVITIKDFGIGIEHYDLPNVFNRFYKGMNSRPDGMGLGLYLVKNIIDKHNGIIKIDSEKSVGTTVTISLPKDR